MQAAQKREFGLFRPSLTRHSSPTRKEKEYQADVNARKKVLAHVENINAFVEGFAVCSKRMELQSPSFLTCAI